MVTIENFVNGEFIKPTGGEWIDKVDPATGQVVAKVPVSGSADVDHAVAAASEAFPGWSSISQTQRSNLLQTLADLLAKNSDAFAESESRDTGKPLALARAIDIPRAIQNLRFFAEAARHWSSESHHDQAGFNYTLRAPHGVSGCIAPWNLPIYLLTWKIAPALATGNTVVAKPSEVTPQTAYLLGQLAREAGIPRGVLNIIHGPGEPTGSALVSHPNVKVVTFTGGTQTGKKIATMAAPALKKISLELGGKNPSLIFDDCAFDKMIPETVRSGFTNQGEVCLCTSRILVHDSIYAKFKEQFVPRVAQLRVKDPLAADCEQGALVSEAHFTKILGAIEQAKSEGGKVLCGGHAVKLEGRCAGGFFVAPTVIEGLGPHCATNQAEIFGPVVALQPFASDEDAIRLANDSAYGLSATIWTNNLQRTHRLARELNSGIIWVNTWLKRDLRTPFGGMKSSGLGREGGLDALRFFTEPKNVCLELS